MSYARFFLFVLFFDKNICTEVCSPCVRDREGRTVLCDPNYLLSLRTALEGLLGSEKIISFIYFPQTTYLFPEAISTNSQTKRKNK